MLIVGRVCCGRRYNDGHAGHYCERIVDASHWYGAAVFRIVMLLRHLLIVLLVLVSINIAVMLHVLLVLLLLQFLHLLRRIGGRHAGRTVRRNVRLRIAVDLCDLETGWRMQMGQLKRMLMLLGLLLMMWLVVMLMLFDRMVEDRSHVRELHQIVLAENVLHDVLQRSRA